MSRAIPIGLLCIAINSRIIEQLSKEKWVEVGAKPWSFGTVEKWQVQRKEDHLWGWGCPIASVSGVQSTYKKRVAKNHHQVTSIQDSTNTRHILTMVS